MSTTATYPAKAKKQRDAPAIIPENPIGTKPPGKLVQFLMSAKQKPEQNTFNKAIQLTRERFFEIKSEKKTKTKLCDYVVGWFKSTKVVIVTSLIFMHICRSSSSSRKVYLTLL